MATKYIKSLLIVVLLAGNIVYAENNEYFPLKEGSSYTYRGYIEIENRTMRDSVVTKSIILNDGHKVYYFLDSDTPSTIGSENFGLGVYAQEGKKIYTLEADLYELGKVKYSDKQLMLDSVINKEMKIAIKAKPYPIHNIALTVKGFEDVEVPAGLFRNCVVIKKEETWGFKKLDVAYIWLAQGVGVVKWHRSTGRIDELVSYDISTEAQRRAEGKAAKDLSDEEVEAYLSWGNEYYNSLRQLDSAIFYYTKLIEINPENADAYLNRGLAYHIEGQRDKAISDYSKAIEINPSFAEVYLNRECAHSQYDKAILDYSKTIELDPEYAEAYNNRGRAYGSIGCYDKAILDYSKAIELDPEYAEAYNNRGYLYKREGNMKEACSDWKKACELGNCSRWGIVNKIRCLGK